MIGSPFYWVYYKILSHDATAPKARPDLAELLSQGTSAVQTSGYSVKKTGNDSTVLLSMAEAELAKEQALLNQMFKANINLDLSKPGSIKILIDAINNCLNLKAVYERNKALITADNKGQKSVISFLHSYILKAYDERYSQIREKIVRAFRGGEEFTIAVKRILNYEFDTYILPNAINYMLNADVEEGVDKKHQKAYAEILRAFNGFSNNPIMSSLKRDWGIETLIDSIAENLSGIRNESGIRKQFKYHRPKNRNKGTRKIISDYFTKSFVASAGGLSLEDFYEQIGAMITREINGYTIQGNDLTLRTDVTNAGMFNGVGRLNARPDVMMRLGINEEPIKTLMEGQENLSREESISLFNRIGSYLEGINDGFIVYTNAKNYTLNQDFRGYSAGSAMSLSQLEGALGRFLTNVPQVISALINTGSGAINEGNTEEFSNLLAQAIAYALFDDWNYIGRVPTGGQAIHVMNLNGVLVPISVMLHSLGQAISNINSSPSSFVTVNIQSASYDTSYPKRFGGLPAWNESHDIGMNNTKISYHFMQNITSFLKF